MKKDNVWVCEKCGYSCTKEKLKFLVLSRPCQLNALTGELDNVVGQEGQISFLCPDCSERHIYISAEWDHIPETHWFCAHCTHRGVKKELKLLYFYPVSLLENVYKEPFGEVQCPKRGCGKMNLVDKKYWDDLEIEDKKG